MKKQLETSGTCSVKQQIPEDELTQLDFKFTTIVKLQNKS